MKWAQRRRQFLIFFSFFFVAFETRQFHWAIVIIISINFHTNVIFWPEYCQRPFTRRTYPIELFNCQLIYKAIHSTVFFLLFIVHACSICIHIVNIELQLCLYILIYRWLCSLVLCPRLSCQSCYLCCQSRTKERREEEKNQATENCIRNVSRVCQALRPITIIYLRVFFLSVHADEERTLMKIAKIYMINLLA